MNGDGDNDQKIKFLAWVKRFLPIMIRQTLRIARPVLWRYKWLILLLIGLSIILGIVPTLMSELEAGVVEQANKIIIHRGPVHFTDILNTALTRFYGDTSGSDFAQNIANLIFRGITLGLAFPVYLLIILTSFALSFISTIVQTKITTNIFARLRIEGLRKGLITDPEELPSLTNVAGQYASAIHQGADNVSSTYGYMLEAGQDLFSLGTTILLVGTRSGYFALFCGITVLLQVLLSVRQARKLKDKREDLDDQRNNLVARTDEILDKREIILAYEQQNTYTKKLGTFTSDYASLGRDLDIQESKYTGYSNIINTTGRIIIIIGALILTLMFSSETLTNIGDIYFFIIMYARILEPIQNLLYKYDNMKWSEATSKSFLELLENKPATLVQLTAPAPEPGVTPIQKQGLDIKFSDVWFRYKSDGPWILKNCSFVIPANTVTLIMGRSGCGKTTIARIILGFWSVTRGEVRVEGKNLEQWDPVELREKMSYVAQGDQIVDDPVHDNLSWAYPPNHATNEQMLQILTQVGVISDPHISTILDEPARNLSGGQQQRLSIARMMLDESPVVLLDEPLTGVDVFTLHDLLPLLDTVLRRPNRTVLIFSHNLVLAKYAHHIIILGENGMVEEEGDPKQLLAKAGGTFATLHQTALQELQ